MGHNLPPDFLGNNRAFWYKTSESCGPEGGKIMEITARIVSSVLGLGGAFGILVAQSTQAEAPMRTDRPVPVQLTQATPFVAISATEKDAIQKVISGYYDAVSRDPAEAASFYGEPTMMVLPNEVFTLSKRGDVEGFLAKLLGGLKPLGYSYSKLGDPRIKMLGTTTAIYSTIAVRYKADGSELQRAGFTYVLHKGESGWKIHELIATDLDKLVSAD
jgi:hypothetical protein